MESLICCLGLAGTIQTWGRAVLDGTMQHLLPVLLGTEEYILPGTSHALLGSFTGWYWPVDYILRILVVFFFEAVDGSHPCTSTIGIYFLGQYLGCLVVMYTDSLRGSRPSFLRATLWSLVFQLTAIGCTGWIWALSFLSSSETAPPVSAQRKHQLKADLRRASAVSDVSSMYLLLPAIIIGYVGSAVAMGLRSPELVSNGFQQYAIAGWNMFPLLVFAAYYALRSLVGIATSLGPAGHSKPTSHLTAIRVTNLLTIVLTSASHWAISGMSLAAVIFPGVFAPGYSQELSPAALAIPPLAITKGRTFGDGVRSFMLWDQVFGYGLVGIVTMRQLSAAMGSSGKQLPVLATRLAILASIVALGPGSAILLMSWIRDEVLFA
ncbi:hypothetical protein CcaCcLH18_05734 [Colletotrichum camelliae]|nr:hypothetical protein CcaCcLH18_05734 [Colletotrichum camelliae]